ncbi:MAG: protease modulator HflC [Planctomycetes bacterium]|nr:protease modulator HflC [Planctomycetota bacterium]
MRNRSAVILGVLVALLLLLYMVSYQVRFDEAVLVTTFGKADESSVVNADGRSAGLGFKWPWPIQDVRTFDTRTRILEAPPEQQQTRDNQVVVVNDFVAWKISNPLEFERALKDPTKAEEQLRNRLRTARALINQYTFDELTNRDPAKLKLDALEAAVLENLRKDVNAKAYGIEIKAAGIKRLELPGDVSEKVFERMKSTRQMLAQSARSEGDAISKDIHERAESARNIILSFAERRAQAIRAEGDAEAASYFKYFKDNEEFAIFLRKIESLKTALKYRTTFLLDTKTVPFDLLAPKPDAAPAKAPDKTGK